MALLAEDGHATRIGTADPLISPRYAATPDSWLDVSLVGSPAVFVQACEGRSLGTALLFQGFGVESLSVDAAGSDPPDANSSIGYARLEDDGSASVDPWNPFFTTMAGIGVTRSERGPAIACRPGSGWVLVYEIADSGSGLSRGLFLALPY